MEIRTKDKQKIFTKGILGILIALCLAAFPGSSSNAEEAAEEVEYTESVELVQNGDFVTQHFGGGSGRRLTASGNWKSELKSRLDRAMDQYETVADVSDLELSRTENIDMVRQIYRECIKGSRFYISGTFSYYAASDTITRIRIGYNSAYCLSDGTPDEELIGRELDRFYAKADEAADYARQGRNALEQMLLAHDWIVRECEYDYAGYLAQSVPYVSFTAYGCLVNGVSVCNGYALAYSYILELLGYESYVVSSNSMNHAWNLVCPDSDWMHVDVTWDDPVFSKGLTAYGYYNDDYSDEGLVSHLYFLKSDSEMQGLSHYKWNVQTSGDVVPDAGTDGVYDSAIFCGDRYSSCYLLGDQWYFCRDGGLYRSSDLYGTETEQIDLGNNGAYYLQFSDGYFYATDFSSLFCYDPSSGVCRTCVDAEQTISELSVKDHRLTYIVTDGESSRRIQYAPVSVLEQPENVEAQEREQIHFQILAEGEGVTYQWQYQGVNNKTWVNWADGRGRELSKVFNPRWNGWKVRCILEDSYGNRLVSDTADLSLKEVIPEIRILSQPQDVSAYNGEDIVFSIEAEGEDLSYQWQYQGKSNKNWVSWADGEEAFLHKKFSSRWDGWKVRCIVSDGYGSIMISESADLKMVEKDAGPVILDQPVSVSAAAGETVAFYITASGDGLSYRWQYQGVYSSNWTDFTLGSTPVLEKTVKTSWNGWKIRCIVEDEHGSSLCSDTAVISVEQSLQG